MRVLVTGAEGFVGSHLVPALLGAGHEVLGTTLDGAAGPRLVLPDDSAAETIVRDFRPDAVVHLAAVSAVTAASASPDLAWRVNVEGTRSLHRAVARCAPGATLLHISSGAVYGAAREGEGPAAETRPCRPAHAYAWSKLAAEAWLRMTADDGTRVVIARPWNHIGPGQSDAFAVSSFARQVAEAEAAGGGEIRAGNLDAERDFLDVRDVVDAYARLIALAGASGVYNVCSGSPRRVGDVLDALRRRTAVATTVVDDPARRRGPEPTPVLGSPARLRDATGWRPRTDFEETLDALLDDWRSRVAQAVARRNA